MKTTGVEGQTVTVDIAEGQYDSPASVAAGGAAFDPLAAGSTVVEASIPGFITTGAGIVNVTVSP